MLATLSRTMQDQGPYSILSILSIATSKGQLIFNTKQRIVRTIIIPQNYVQTYI